MLPKPSHRGSTQALAEKGRLRNYAACILYLPTVESVQCTVFQTCEKIYLLTKPLGIYIYIYIYISFGSIHFWASKDQNPLLFILFSLRGNLTKKHNKNPVQEQICTSGIVFNFTFTRYNYLIKTVMVHTAKMLCHFFQPHFGVCGNVKSLSASH